MTANGSRWRFDISIMRASLGLKQFLAELLREEPESRRSCKNFGILPVAITILSGRMGMKLCANF